MLSILLKIEKENKIWKSCDKKRMSANATLYWQNFWTESFLRLASSNSQKALFSSNVFHVGAGKKWGTSYINSEKAETLP